MASTQNQASALRNFERLSESDQEDANWLANSILAIWPRPELSPEGRLYFIDDIAVIFKQFGKATLQRAIDDARQSTDRRPSPASLRSRCGEIRGTAKNPISPEMRQYHRDVQEHPEEFVPLALIARDVEIRLKRKRAGKPFTQPETERQLEDTRKEWRQMVKEGKHKEPMQVSLTAVMEAR